MQQVQQVQQVWQADGDRELCLLQVAEAIDASERLQLQSGMLIGVPIPHAAEAEAVHVQARQDTRLAMGRTGSSGEGGAQLPVCAYVTVGARCAPQGAIETALAEVDAHGIGGREVTPYLLKRVNELTVGASLTANIALIKNNAAAGGEIAVQLARLRAARR